MTPRQICAVLLGAVAAAAWWAGARDAFAGEGALLPYAVHELERVLTQGECAALIQAAEPRLARSRVVGRGGEPARERVSDARTSTQAWLGEGDPGAGAAVGKLLRTAAALTGVRRRDLLGSVMVARYTPGQEYRPHRDACTRGCDRGAIYRRATLLVYLNDNYRGGTTSFPGIGRTVRPRAGGGVLFYDTAPETGEVIGESLHSGDPVKDGVKYIATVWVSFPPELHGFDPAAAKR